MKRSCEPGIGGPTIIEHARKSIDDHFGSDCAACVGSTNESATAAIIQRMAFMTTSLHAGGGMPPHGGRIIRNCHSNATEDDRRAAKAAASYRLARAA